MKRTLTIFASLLLCIASFGQDRSFNADVVNISNADFGAKDMYFDRQRVELENVHGTGTWFFSQCTGFIKRGVNENAQSKCIVGNGCNNFKLIDCEFTGNLDVDATLVEFGPGHPWSFADVASKLGAPFSSRYRWKLGTNLCGGSMSYAQGDAKANVVTLNNQTEFTVPNLTPLNIWNYPAPRQVFEVWKDGEEPVECSLVSYSGVSTTLRSPKPLNGTYKWYSYDPMGYVRNITVQGCTFRNSNGGLLSLYAVDGYMVKNNIGSDGIGDGFTFEMTKYGTVTGNRVRECQPINYGPGWADIVFHGRQEQIDVSGNTGTVFARTHGQPWLGVTMDSVLNGDKYVPRSKPPTGASVTPGG